MSRIKVGVRVRPFSVREETMDAKCILAMDNNITLLTNPDTGEENIFTFDHCYWSHDGFAENPNTGLLVGRETSDYADQDTIFCDFGIEMLNWAFDGENSCIFSYGQTGSGKTFSMAGYGNNHGILPKLSEELFVIAQRLTLDSKSQIWFDIYVSMIEVYNENIYDLLGPPESRAVGGLKLVEGVDQEIYEIEGLIRQKVNFVAEMEQVLDIGNANRTIGATLMNATSSRAHTMDKNRGVAEFSTESRIKVVELAGSEGVAGVVGARGKGPRAHESSKINKSLNILWATISGLATDSLSKQNEGAIHSYSDSILTKILQADLKGKSKTYLIATLNPASIDYKESLRTLEFASRVKSLRNKPTQKEYSPKKLINKEKYYLKPVIKKYFPELNATERNNKHMPEVKENLLNNLDGKEILEDEKNHSEETREDWKDTLRDPLQVTDICLMNLTGCTNSLASSIASKQSDRFNSPIKPQPPSSLIKKNPKYTFQIASPSNNLNRITGNYIKSSNPILIKSKNERNFNLKMSKFLFTTTPELTDLEKKHEKSGNSFGN